MLEEKGTVTRIEPDALWVETVQTSTCDVCSANKGCGQRLLARALQNATSIRILLRDRSPDEFCLNETVRIGIPEHVVVLGSLGVYLLPLLAMFAGLALGRYLDAAEGQSVLFALGGLVVGGALVRWFSWRTRNNPDLQPVLLDP